MGHDEVEQCGNKHVGATPRQPTDDENTDSVYPTYRGVERGARSWSGETVAVVVVVRARDARQTLETDCTYFGEGRTEPQTSGYRGTISKSAIRRVTS